MHKQINPGAFYYGFPVILLSTIDEQGKTNITPISSSWNLGDNVVIGLGTNSKGYENLKKNPEAVLNIVPENLMKNIIAIEKLTGKTCSDKFAIAGLTAQDSVTVKPQRVKESPLQAEVKIINMQEREGYYAIIEMKIIIVHAEPEILFDENRIDPNKWKPLIYNFRHYHGITDSKGKQFKAYC